MPVGPVTAWPVEDVTGIVDSLKYGNNIYKSGDSLNKACETGMMDTP